MWHTPNMAEQLMKIKKNDQHKTLEKLKNNSTNQAITQRTKMGVASWHTHKNRAIQSALIRQEAAITN